MESKLPFSYIDKTLYLSCTFRKYNLTFKTIDISCACMHMCVSMVCVDAVRTFLAVFARVSSRTDALASGGLTLGAIDAVTPLLAVLATVALGTRCNRTGPGQPRTLTRVPLTRLTRVPLARLKTSPNWTVYLSSSYTFVFIVYHSENIMQFSHKLKIFSFIAESNFKTQIM